MLISDLTRTAQVRAKAAVDVISVSRDAFKALVRYLPSVKDTMEEITRSHEREVGLGEELSEATTSSPNSEAEERPAEKPDDIAVVGNSEKKEDKNQAETERGTGSCHQLPALCPVVHASRFINSMTELTGVARPFPILPVCSML